MAAARNVSAAASTTRRPCARSRAASLPMVVVLPVPLTPTTSTIAGPPSAAGCGSQCSASRGRRAGRRARRGPRPRRRGRGASGPARRGPSTSAAPTSPVISVSSISSQSARRRRRTRSGAGAPNPTRDFSRPSRALALPLAAGGVGLLGAVVGAPGPLDGGSGCATGSAGASWPRIAFGSPAGRARARSARARRRRRAGVGSATRRRSGPRRPGRSADLVRLVPASAASAAGSARSGCGPRDRGGRSARGLPFSPARRRAPRGRRCADRRRWPGPRRAAG